MTEIEQIAEGPVNVDGLRTAVLSLGSAIKMSDKEAGRIRRNQRIMYVVIGILIGALVWMSIIAGNASDAAKTAQRAADAANKAQVVTCQSANESRAGADYVWDVIWTLFSSPNMTDKERLNIVKLNDFTNQVYAARDCSQPNKKFVLPPKPVLQQ